MSHLKVSLIGLGSVASIYLDVISKMPSISLVSVVEPDLIKVGEKNFMGTAHFNSVEEMLKSGEIPNVAIVCSPPATHEAIVSNLLYKGSDCLIEKPMAMNPEEASRIKLLAKKLGRTVATSTKFRVLPALLQAQQRIKQGLIGELRKVECIFTSKLDSHLNWRGSPRMSGGGVWMDNGPHAIDVIETLAGPVKKIFMEGRKFLQNSLVEDEVVVMAEHENGTVSQIQLSWNEQIKAPYARCIGSEGEIIADWGETFSLQQGKKDNIFTGYDKNAAFSTLLQNFIDGRIDPALVQDYGEGGLSWIFAAYKSALTHKWESLE